MRRHSFVIADAVVAVALATLMATAHVDMFFIVLSFASMAIASTFLQK